MSVPWAASAKTSGSPPARVPDTNVLGANPAGGAVAVAAVAKATSRTAPKVLRSMRMVAATQVLAVSCVHAHMRLRTVVSLLAVLALAPAAHATDLSSSDFSTAQLKGADSGTEPRITVDRN